MRALVTGGAGYFGEILVERLRREGDAVRIFDRNLPDRPAPGVEVVQGDVRDLDAVVEATRGVFHNVAQVPLAKDRHLFWSVNQDGTRNVLEAALQGRVRKVVNTSSSAVFGVPAVNPVPEDAAAVPQEEYGRAKLAGERLCAEYAARGLDVSVIRPRTVIGHGRLGIFQILFEWIHQGKNVPVLDGGRNLYQFVHADDLADACLRAGARRGPRTYHCGAERFGTMREALEAVCARAGTGSRVRSVPMRLALPAMRAASVLGLSPLGAYHALMYGRSMYFDVSRAARELGWRPRYSNEEMLCESYAWYVAHREEVLVRSGASHHRSAVRQGVLRAVHWFL
jgi:nucleoside-diphosphate-sugar epimerase